MIVRMLYAVYVCVCTLHDGSQEVCVALVVAVVLSVMVAYCCLRGSQV